MQKVFLMLTEFENEKYEEREDKRLRMFLDVEEKRGKEATGS